jgi:hypothetical protein
MDVKREEESMPQMPLGKQEKQMIESFLRTYTFNKKLLGIEKYQKEYELRTPSFLDSTDAEMLKEAPLARSRMYYVRHFILDMPNSDEKLLLYYHYIKGESTERCAELLGISRRSAFRLKNRALVLAYERLNA